MIKMRDYRGAPSFREEHDFFEEEDEDIMPRRSSSIGTIRNPFDFDDEEPVLRGKIGRPRRGNDRFRARERIRELSSLEDELEDEDDFDISFSGARISRRREPRSYLGARSSRRGMRRMPESLMRNPRAKVEARKGYPYVVARVTKTKNVRVSSHKTRDAATKKLKKARKDHPRQTFKIISVPWARTGSAPRKKATTAKAGVRRMKPGSKVKVEARKGYPYVIVRGKSVRVSSHRTRDAAKKALTRLRNKHPRSTFSMVKVGWAKTTAKPRKNPSRNPSSKGMVGNPLAWHGVTTSKAYPWLVVDTVRKVKVGTASKTQARANKKLKLEKERHPKGKFKVVRATVSGYKALPGKATKSKGKGPLRVDGITATKKYPWVVFDYVNKRKVKTASKTQAQARKKMVAYKAVHPKARLRVVKATPAGATKVAASAPRKRSKEQPGAIKLKGMKRWSPWAIADSNNNWIVGARTNKNAKAKLEYFQAKYPQRKLRVVSAARP